MKIAPCWKLALYYGDFNFFCVTFQLRLLSMVNLKNSIKNTNTLFFACYGKRVSKFYNELSNINLNDLYWTKISTKPLRFFKKFRKNTRFRMVIISIIRLILKLKGFIETIINIFFLYHFETINGFKKKIKFLVVSMKLLWFQIVILGQNWLKMRFRVRQCQA